MASNDYNTGTQVEEARKALERFIVDSDNLLALESRIDKFNIFDALKLAIRRINAEGLRSGPLSVR